MNLKKRNEWILKERNEWISKKKEWMNFRAKITRQNHTLWWDANWWEWTNFFIAHLKWYETMMQLTFKTIAPI